MTVMKSNVTAIYQKYHNYIVIITSIMLKSSLMYIVIKQYVHHYHVIDVSTLD